MIKAFFATVSGNRDLRRRVESIEQRLDELQERECRVSVNNVRFAKLTQRQFNESMKMSELILKTLKGKK